jgi:cobalt-zinc-cadmium efflux system protein
LSGNVLLEATPAHINVAAVEEAVLKVNGIEAVHDLHIWTITSGMEALSVHVVLDGRWESQTTSEILETLVVLLKEKFGIDHTTIQIEHSSRWESEMQH